MVNLTENQIEVMREKRYRERDLQINTMNDTEITDEEKYRILKAKYSSQWLYYKVFQFYEKLLSNLWK